MVYFIFAEKTNRIKVGFCSSLNIKNRLRSLQTGSPDKLSILGLIPNGDRDLESEIHSRFNLISTAGEWFIADIKLLDFIRDNAYINSNTFMLNYTNKTEIIKLDSLKNDVGEAIKRRNSYYSEKPTCLRRNRKARQISVSNTIYRED